MDTKNRTLWIFGPSLTLPWKLSDPTQGWPSLVAKDLGIPNVQNHGESSVDNFFIYQSFLNKIHLIAPRDLLILGWSHPNRKMFVLDRDNPNHLGVLSNSLLISQEHHEFIRSSNPVKDDRSKWSLMRPKNSGYRFYDQWFRDYFSEYEQRCNFQAYYDSVHHRSPCQCVSIFFSKESVNDVVIDPTVFYLDFVMKHKVNLAEDDLHLNQQGHRLFKDELLPFIQIAVA